MNAFQPGDKVVRVGDNTPGMPLFSKWPAGCGPKKGKVYVVRDCWYGRRGYALCQIVGFPDVLNALGEPCGWPASAFRKLEEIQAENKDRICSRELLKECQE